MALRTLTTDQPQDEVLQEHIHPLTLASADPLAAPVVPIFDKLIGDWKARQDQRIQLLIAIARAQAIAIYADSKLDAFVLLLVNTLERINKDRTTAIWFIFFKGVSPSAFVKSVLQGQLAKMKTWPKSLADSPHPELAALAPQLEPLLDAGTAAEAALALARQDLLNFQTVGGWAEHIAQSNAGRTDAYGSLLDIPHQNPGLKLRKDYAELFFLHDTSRRGANKAKTSKELKADLIDHDKDRAALVNAIAEAEEREQEGAQREAELEAKRQELEELDKQEAANAARRKQLEDELGKGKKK